MALIKSYRGLTPKWGKDCYFSENATIVGEVTMGMRRVLRILEVM